MLEKLYRTFLIKIPAVRELVLLCKESLRRMNGAYQRYAPPTWAVSEGETSTSAGKWAVIADEFTWDNLSASVDAVYLTPGNWRERMEQDKPELFFCESAWEGIDGSWNNMIFRNHEYRRDNRRVLFDILRYCREAGIPTVFWNKEDTPAFSDEPFGFIDTAMRFDHIFTTCAECIPAYQEMGHKSVHLMMFGYTPQLFSVMKPRPKQNIAVFLGSWYENNRERCQEMRDMFELVLRQGMELRIYDRVSERHEPARQYPKEFMPYVRPMVPYRETGRIMNEADYVININTVKDSKTMFARRVFEAMACGRIVISNDSVGMRQLFGRGVWFLGEPFDHRAEEQIIAEYINLVQTEYTFEKQMTAALHAAKIQIGRERQ